MNQITTSAAPVGVPPEPEFSFNIGEDADSLERMCALYARFGDIYRVRSPSRRGYVYVVNHPDDVKRVLVSNHANYRKGFGLDRVRMLLGNGIVTSDGELWRTQRYMMQPMFHRRVVTQFAAVIDAANDRLLERWERRAAQGEPINVTDEMSEVTLEFILRAIFGEDLDRITRELGENPFDIITKDSVRDLAFAARFHRLRKLVADIVARRRAQAGATLDFIGMLVEARDKGSGVPMGDRELLDEVMTLIVAGHETAASGLNSVWYLLSQHPEVEAKLHREVDALGEHTAPSLQISESLDYARRIVNEALRLYPPVWVLSRQSIGPDRLAGYDIPAGVEVLLSPYLVHRHPQFWNEPEQFRPERAEPQSPASGPLFARIPFGAGARRCIGESLALYEMSIHLYRVARRFRLTHAPAPPMQLEALINLRTKHPVWMRLERRP
ncbi:MAG TPA: cytochrome P450 [Steroidobacteraceae bacterium]